LPDGATLVAASEAGEVLTWQFATRLCRTQPTVRLAGVQALTVAADGVTAAGLTDGKVAVWRLDRPDPAHWLNFAPPGSKSNEYRAPHTPLALAPDGSRVAVSTSEAVVYAGPVGADVLPRVYSQEGNEEAEPGPVEVYFTRAGRLLVAISITDLRDHQWIYTLGVDDGFTGACLWRSEPQILWHSTFALSADGTTLYSGHDDGTVLVWPLAPG
jgi:hypothetical protein